MRGITRAVTLSEILLLEERCVAEIPEELYEGLSEVALPVAAGAERRAGRGPPSAELTSSPGNEDLFGSGVDHTRVDRTNVELALYGTEPYNWR